MKAAATLSPDDRTSRRRGLFAFALFAIPTFIAIWVVPYFSTQDGPLHLLNAHITIELFKQPAAFDNLYRIHWDPLPYWTGHLLLTGLMSVVSERIADRTLITLTSLGLASAMLWLRWRVSGWHGMAVVAPLAIVLSLNTLWLLGLYSFLLGTSLMLITLGVWWRWRDQMGPLQAALLALLLVTGYASHLISLGMTVCAIGVLAITTPGVTWKRLGWTATSMLPLVPLLWMYHRMMQSSGEIHAAWDGLDNALSLRAWFNYARNADFIQIRSIACLPFASQRAGWVAYSGPPQIAQLVIFILLIVTFLALRKGEAREHRGWLILAILLFAVALFGPDGFGNVHGGILRERILLIAMAVSIPAMNLHHHRRLIIGCGTVLMIAVAVQVLFVWDYALYSNRVVKDVVQAKSFVGTSQHVETIQIDSGDSYRPNPRHNLSNIFGIGTDNIVWNNYGPCLYYFPVRFASTQISERALSLSDVSVFNFKDSDESDHLRWYEQLLSETHEQIDTLVVIGTNKKIDRINAQWYGPEPVYESGEVRVFRRAPHPNTITNTSD